MTEGVSGKLRPRTLQLATAAEIGRRLRAIGRTLSRPPTEPGRPVAAPMLLLGAAALALAALSFVTGLDAQVALLMRGEPEGVRSFLSVLTDVALILWYFYPALFLSIGLLVLEVQPSPDVLRHRLSRLFALSTWLAASLGTATTIVHAVKYALGRARPELLDTHGTGSIEFLRLGSAFESFPSGHSSNAGVMAMAIAIWCPALRWPALALGAAIAATRIVVERHFLSDVVAGYAVGALTALALARALALRRIAYRVERGGRGWRGLLPRLA